MTISGRCLCEKVQYTISGPPISQGICYCRHCQIASGALGSPLIVIGKDMFTCSSKELSSFTIESARGSAVTRHFCKVCGSPVFSEISDVPGIMTVKVGALDMEDSFKPDYLVWTKSTTIAGIFPEGMPRFPESAPIEIMLKLSK